MGLPPNRRARPPARMAAVDIADGNLTRSAHRFAHDGASAACVDTVQGLGYRGIVTSGDRHVD